MFAAGEVRDPLRAKIPRAAVTPRIDGQLEEYEDAFCTPIEYFHADAKNRSAQFYYLWDDEAFYVAVRTLDGHPYVPQELFWTGDAVEWYFDTRPLPAEERLRWGPGAVHCFLSALTLDTVQPQFLLRPGYEDAIPQIGIQVVGRRWEHGLEYEFCLPWSNFPSFHPHAGEELHLDAELSYSDGVARSFRSFVFSSPLSVECPANLARVQLVDKFEQDDWRWCGPAMMPIRVDAPWEQSGVPQVRASIALPPNRSTSVGRVVFQILDTQGQVRQEFAAENEDPIDAKGNFTRQTATWAVDLAAPGTYHVQAVVYDRAGDELTRITPRLVSVNMDQGY